MIDAPSGYDTQNASGSKCPIYQVLMGPMRKNLVSAWKLGEASSTREDFTTKNPLTPVNAPGTSAGKIGATAIQLTAASSQYLYTNVSDNHSLLIRNESFMVCGWFYLDSKAADRYAISHYESTAVNQSWYLVYANGTDRFQFSVLDTGSNNYVAVANNLGSPSISTWYFIVAWFDVVAHTVNIRVNNGTANSTATGSLQIQASTVPFRIGAIDLGAGAVGFWSGRIEQVMLWKRLLTSTEQSTLYNSGTGTDFQVLTDPEPLYEFSSAHATDGVDIGPAILEMIDLVRESQIENSETALSTLTFQLNDLSNAVTTVVAAGIVGYRCRLLSSFQNIASTNLSQMFGGTVAEVSQVNGRYRIMARGYMAAGQDKVIFAPAQTQLFTAVNSSDTTFVVYDASAWPDAVSVPQAFRKLAQIDTEIVEYRGKSQNVGGTWNLNSVVRSASVGYPFPPFFGGPASHAANAVMRQLPKLGSLIPDTNQALKDWMHPIEYMKQILTIADIRGLGEFDIPINNTEFDTAKTLLGETLQFRYIFTAGINGKSLIESICRDLAAYPTEDNNGAVGIKLYPTPSVLHAAWKLEESSGTRIDQMHIGGSRNYDLTPGGSGTLGTATGKIGQAAQFTSANSQYLWRVYGGLQPAGGSFSIAAWVYLDAKAANMVVCSQFDNTSIGQDAFALYYDQAADRFKFVTGDGTSLFTATASTFGSPSTATWYFLVATFTRSTLQLGISVNGGTVNTATATDYPVPTTEKFRIGAWGPDPGGSFWNGRIDELGMFYDHVLTSTEIAALYNSGTGVAIESYDTLFPTWSLNSVDTITDSHILERPRWIRNAEKIINSVVYYYDFTSTGDYASTFSYKDQTLIDTIGKENILEIFSKGIRSRLFEAGPFCWFDSTERFLLNRAKAHIARFGNKAPVISVQALHRKHLIEMSDDISATLDQVTDLDSSLREIVNAPMEISKLEHDYESQVVNIELVGYPSS